MYRVTRYLSRILPKRVKTIIKLAIPFVFFIIVLFLPTPSGLTRSGHVMFSVFLFAGMLFIIQPIPLGMCGLLVLIMPVILGIAEPHIIFSSFGNSAVFFLIGAFIIAATIEKSGIHKRIALWFLKIAGKSPRAFILSTMLSGAILSFIMPEHGVIVLIVPVLMYILVGMKLRPQKSNFAKSVMIGAAYGCSIGSLATPLGGARNPLTIGFLQYHGLEVDFLNWIILALPVVIFSLAAVWLILIIIWPPEIEDLKEGHTLIEMEVEKLPRLSFLSIRVFIVLFICIGMWIFLPYISTLNLAVISLIGGIIIFISGNCSWEEIESHIPWGIILLYGGAISLGVQLAESGAATWLADLIIKVSSSSPFIVIIIIICMTKLITEVMSNTAAVSILLPIAYGIAHSMGIPPVMMCMLVGLAGGLAFMFLISTPGNIIAYSTGYFDQKHLFKAGVFANIVTILIMFGVAMTFWKWIGVW